MTDLIERDAAERETRINELWRGEDDWHDGRDTILAYDSANNVTTRRVDGLLFDPGPTGLAVDDGPCTGDLSECEYRDGRTTAFTYDALDRESTMDIGSAIPRRPGGRATSSRRERS